MTQSKNLTQKAGFTLIELSIVLVIIGLIVGGVLVGQDLIKAAEIRATISQYEKFNSSVNTFRGKFNALPGDMAQAQALAFGLFQLTNTTTLGQGDANGMIEGGGTAGSAAPVGEVLTFWRHLSDANLTDGSYGVVGNSAIVAATGVVTGAVTDVSRNLPVAKLGPAGFFTVYSISGLNYYHLIPVATITTGPAFTSGSSGMTPIQAFNIDTKLDDGAPNTGIVVARSLLSAELDAAPTHDAEVGGPGLRPSTAAAASSTVCTVDSGTGTAAALDATDTYNRDQANGGNSPTCSLRFRFN